MNINKSLTAALIAGFALTACGGGAGGGSTGTNPPGVSNPAKPANNVLQLAVGSANIAGQPLSLNVVATYRQPTGSYAPGDSGTLINTPTLTVAGSLPTLVGSGAAWDPTSTAAGNVPDPAVVPGGPSSTEEGGHVITSTSQNVGSANLTSFGQSGGVFGVGIEPFNSLGEQDGNGTAGTPFTYVPYPVPLYDPLAYTDPNQFIPWGGPPAFGAQDSNMSPVNAFGNSNWDFPTGVSGVSLGLDVFDGVAPTAGQYQLAVSVPANTGTTNQTASASLGAAPAALPFSTATFTTDAADAGGTAAVVLTGATTEAYVEIADYGPAQPATVTAGDTAPASCNGASAGAPVYYTLVAHSSGTYTLGDASGPQSPTGGTSPSLCSFAANAAYAGNSTADPTQVTGDEYSVQVIGFDYPQFEITYPSSLKNPTPVIVGQVLAGGVPTDDLSAGPATCAYEATGGTVTPCTADLPLLHRRAMSAAYGHAHVAAAVRLSPAKTIHR